MISSKDLDFNTRPDPLLDKPQEGGLPFRVIQASLPFFYLYRPLATPTTVAMGGLSVYRCLRDRKGSELALVVLRIGLGVLRPREGILVGECFQLYQSTKDYKSGELTFTKLTQKVAAQVLQVASAYYAKPALLAASMMLQTLEDGSKSYEEFQKGRCIEALSHLILSSIRLRGAVEQSERAYRDYYTRPIDQKGFDQVVLDMERSEGGLTLGEALDRKFYSRVIEGINCTDIPLSNATFEGVTFVECTFSNFLTFNLHIQDSSFRRCIFKDSSFDHSLIQGVDFLDCSFSNTWLEGGSFKRVFFDRVWVSDTLWKGMNWHDVCWEESSILEVEIEGCHLENTRFTKSKFYKTEWRANHFAGDFKESKLEDSSFVGGVAHLTLTDSQALNCEFKEVSFEGFCSASSSFTQAAFFSCEGDGTLNHCWISKSCLPKEFDRIGCVEGERPPVVGLTWHQYPPPFAAGQNDQFKDLGAAVFKFNKHPDSVDPKRLADELQGRFKHLKTQPKEGSILRSILEGAEPGSEVEKLRKLGQQIADQVDLVVLPGGDDLEPQLYGYPCHHWTRTEGDFRRSILEGALLISAEERNIPVLGICRGEQMINIFEGGTLHQYVPHQWGEMQMLSVEGKGPGAKVMREAIGGDTVQAYSCHAQSVASIGHNLEEVINYKGVTKVIISPDGRLMGCQFHPETGAVYSKEALKRGFPELNEELFGRNQNILSYMLDLARQRQSS